MSKELKPVNAISSSATSSVSEETKAFASKQHLQQGEVFGICDLFETPKYPRVQYRPSLRRTLDMTVGIVAVCDGPADHKIITCSDYLLSSGIGSSESFQKCWSLKPGWVALFSGEKSSISTMAKKYVRSVRDSDITDTNISSVVNKPMHERKRELIEEYLQSKFSISYENFLNSGKTQFPEDVYRRALDWISRIDIESEAIVAGFIGNAATICQTSTDGKSILYDDFATIGEGGLLAQAALMNRRFNSHTKLTSALYMVYEAKKHAERVRSVGAETALFIFYKDGTGKAITDAGQKYLQTLYTELNPPDIKGDFEDKPEFYRDLPH